MNCESRFGADFEWSMVLLVMGDHPQWLLDTDARLI